MWTGVEVESQEEEEEFASIAEREAGAWRRAWSFGTDVTSLLPLAIFYLDPCHLNQS
jgi:hypothetical protein